MKPEDLKVPKKRPSIIDQAGNSIYSIKRPVKYANNISSVRGLETGTATPIRKAVLATPPTVTDNDYVDNYVNDYFE